MHMTLMVVVTRTALTSEPHSVSSKVSQALKSA